MALLFPSLSLLHSLSSILPEVVSDCLKSSPSLSPSEGRQRQHPQSRRDRDVGDGGQTRAHSAPKIWDLQLFSEMTL